MQCVRLSQYFSIENKKSLFIRIKNSIMGNKNDLLKNSSILYKISIKLYLV